MKAAIDIGTNTILLLVAETTPRVEQEGAVVTKVFADECSVVRLGQGVHRNRCFAPEAIERAYQCLQKYRNQCDALGVPPQEIYAVATSASRDAANSQEFYERVARELGIEVKVISGPEEAQLTFYGGLLPGQDPKKTAVLDIGGGSTEFVTVKKRQSLDIGSVRATEMFLRGDPYEKPTLLKLEGALRALWTTLDEDLQVDLCQKEWVGVAGTVTTLAAVALGMTGFHADKLDGVRLERCIVGDLYESLATQTQAQRVKTLAIEPGRADVITAGAAILYSAMEYFDKPDVIVSTRGLRYGVLSCPLS